ncbi:MAG: hypothetical protein AAGE52_20140 [Myxococcota bacterium]
MDAPHAAPFRQSAQLECQSCGARLEIEPQQRTGKCLYCGSPQVLDRPASPDRPNPTFAVGFVITRERALEIAQGFVTRAYFAPEAFRKSTIEEIRGIYLPCYLYSAVAHSSYSVSIGENYTVTETYTTTDSKGNTVTRTRTRVETEWRSLSGNHTGYLSDVVVTASRGLPNDELEAIEPFDMRALKRYGPKIVSGWVAEEPSLAPNDCYAMARQEAMGSVQQRLGQFMPGDKHRGLQHNTQFHNEDLELTLLPIWVLPVRYAEDKPVVRLLVNGQTGRVAGRAPKSWVKITLVVLFFVALIAGAIFLMTRNG